MKDLASPVVSRDKAVRGGFVTAHQASECQLSIQPPMPSHWDGGRAEVRGHVLTSWEGWEV